MPEAIADVVALNAAGTLGSNSAGLLGGLAIVKANKLIYQLQRVVSASVRNIALFSDLYGEEPTINSLDDFQKLPTTSRDDYARLKDVSDAVRNPWDMTSPLAPWRWNASRFPIAVLHSAKDELVLDERIKYLLTQSGIEEGQRVTLLVGLPQVYAASDLAEVLVYMGRPCEMLLLDGERDSDVHDRLAKANAVCVFLCCDRDIRAEAFPSCVRSVVTFSRGLKLQTQAEHTGVLHLDEIPVVAVAKGDGQYRSPPGHFFFERSGEGNLAVTTLQQDYAPFIRYDTGIRATVSGNSFRLE